MIEITTKYHEICNCTDVELKDVFDYCKIAEYLTDKIKEYQTFNSKFFFR